MGVIGLVLRLAHLLISGNDMLRDGGMRSSECPLAFV